MRRYRVFMSMLMAALMVAGWSWRAYALSGDSVSFVAPPPEGARVAGGTDYAEHTFSDPWDMSNPEDLSTHTRRLDHRTFSGGLFSAEVTGVRPYLYIMWGGYPIAAPLARDGLINRIDTNRYKLFYLRMYSSRSDHAWLAWNYTQDLRSWHDRSFYIREGWNTYLIDLSNEPEWSGRPINLRLDLTDDGAGARLKIDWIRLATDPGSNFPVQVTDTEPSGTVDFFHDTDTAGYDGTYLTTASSSSDLTVPWDTSRLPLGRYYLYGEKDGIPSSYSGPLVVNAPPVPSIVDPNAFGGRDYATDVLHNPWDFNTRSDIARMAFIGGARFRAGVFSGYNTNNDPYLYMHVHRIPSKYHRLSIRYKFSGTRDVGRGTIARFVWYIAGREYRPQVTADLVGEGGWNTYTFDIARIRRAAGSLGWRNYVGRLRFDPHEDRTRRWFYINYIRLNKDDQAGAYFDVKYRVGDTDDSTVTVNLYRDTDASGYNGVPIATGLEVRTNALQTYRWQTATAGVHGRFHLYMEAQDRVNTSRIYSTGPVVTP